MLAGRVYTPAQRRGLRPRRFLVEVEVAEDGDGDVADGEGGGAVDSEGEEEQMASQSGSRCIGMCKTPLPNSVVTQRPQEFLSA